MLLFLYPFLGGGERHGKPYSGNYRRNWRRYNQTAEWVMNDETALVLRKLKNADGNYIWNHNADTIFGSQYLFQSSCQM